MVRTPSRSIMPRPVPTAQRHERPRSGTGVVAGVRGQPQWKLVRERDMDQTATLNISSPRSRRRVGVWTSGVIAVAVVTLAIVAVVSVPRGRSAIPGGRPAARPGAPTTTIHAAPTSTDPEAMAGALRPTTSAPLHVLEIGDSLGIDLGDQLQSQLDAAGWAVTTVASLGDS